LETHNGQGRLLDSSGQLLAEVEYEYQIDRTHRVWKGVARRLDGEQRLAIAAGPAEFVVSTGDRAMVNFYHRMTDTGAVIAFTGRGAPPGE
jgi:hypothetical protein